MTSAMRASASLPLINGSPASAPPGSAARIGGCCMEVTSVLLGRCIPSSSAELASSATIDGETFKVPAGTDVRNLLGTRQTPSWWFGRCRACTPHPHGGAETLAGGPVLLSHSDLRRTSNTRNVRKMRECWVRATGFRGAGPGPAAHPCNVCSGTHWWPSTSTDSRQTPCPLNDVRPAPFGCGPLRRVVLYMMVSRSDGPGRRSRCAPWSGARRA